MNSTYRVVLQDYPRRVRFPASLVLIAFLLMPAVKGFVEGAQWGKEYGPFAGGLILVLWTGLVSGHLKQVLARPQTRLLPGYASTQLRSALLLVMPALIFAIVAFLLAGHPPLRSVAIPLLLFSVFGGYSYLFDRGFLLMLFAPSLVWWVSMLDQQVDLHSWLLVGQRETIGTYLAIAASLCLSLFVGWRMLHLTESSFEYDRDPSIGWRRGSSPDSDAPFAGFFRRVMPWFGRYRISARSSLYGASSWERISHWRKGMGPISPMVTGLSMAGIVALIGLFFMLYEERHATAEGLILVAYLMMFPFSRYSYIQRRRARFEMESLYPASREKIVHELAWATTLDILESWFFLVVGTLIARSFGLLGSVPWAHFPYFLVLTLGTTCFGLGMVPWFLRLQGDKLPSFFLSMLVLAVGLSVELSLQYGMGFLNPAMWLLATMLLMVLGATGAYHGYQLWCRLELGRSDL